MKFPQHFLHAVAKKKKELGGPNMTLITSLSCKCGDKRKEIAII